FPPDYTIFQDPISHRVYQEARLRHKSILISKEELGHDYSKGECDYSIFPDDASIEHTKAAFLFRDPIRVFDSWKAVGWTDIQSLLIAYRKLFNTWAASEQSSIAFTYEELIHQPEATIARLCRHWDITFSHQLLSFKHPFGNGFLYTSERERRIYTTDNPLGIFNTIHSNNSINSNIKSHNLLTPAEKNLIELNLGSLYMATYGDRIAPLKAALASKTHFGFDLDDTLHSFRAASSTAATAVFEYLSSSTHSSTTNTAPTVDELKKTYAQILSRTTSTGFADGKTSEEYRRGRFLALMQAHTLHPSSSSSPSSTSSNRETMLPHLLHLYKSTLLTSLQLKPGALPLLQKLKSLNKTVV
ncbi:MAG: hypothetical protein Q9226_009384, partial [Calogaya cf. arnoldii]